MSYKADLAKAAMFGGAAAIIFGLYFSQPQLKNIDLVGNEASYVQEYSGPSPTEALDHALASLEIVESSNPTYAPKIQELETQLSQYKAELGGIESELIYNPVLDQVSDELDIFENKYSRSGLTLGVGIVDAVLGAFYLGIALLDDDI